MLHPIDLSVTGRHDPSSEFGDAQGDWVMTVHEAASVGFSSQAEAYRRGRPEYPMAIDTWLADRLGLCSGRVVVDLGAGTGKFTRRLVATGAQVTAVEPVAEMRAQFALAVPEALVLDGCAEAIPLPDASADALVCAQSFHWFANATALAEIHRVLRPNGVLGLIWNARDESVDWVAAVSRIITPFEGSVPRYHKGDWRRLFPGDGFGPLEESVFPHGHKGPVEQVLIDRILSVSFIAAMSEDRRNLIAAELRHLAATHPDLAGQTEIVFPYRTEAFCCRRLAQSV
jgi:SAM-dependent methyltransferase